MPIHPTAIVDPRAEIDPTADIGAYATIEGEVRIAARVRVLTHAHLRGWTGIAEDCEIHMGAVVGHEPQDYAYSGERTYCEIGPRTVIREHATVHRGTVPESKTVVGADCLLGVSSHVAHNCVVADRVVMMNGALLGGHVRIGARTFISGNAGVHQFVRVGELVMLSGNASISSDIPPFMLAHDRNRITGINRVGMKRAELSTEEIAEARRAYKELYRNGRAMSRSIAYLADTLVTPAGRRLVEFLQAPRKRPLVRPRRSVEHQTD